MSSGLTPGTFNNQISISKTMGLRRVGLPALPSSYVPFLCSAATIFRAVMLSIYAGNIPGVGVPSPSTYAQDQDFACALRRLPNRLDFDSAPISKVTYESPWCSVRMTAPLERPRSSFFVGWQNCA